MICFSYGLCGEPKEGGLCAARLHEEIEIGNRPSKAGCGIDRGASEACADNRCGGPNVNDTDFEQGSGNVFADLDFSPAEAAELAVKSALISNIRETIQLRNLTQQAAARLCGTDQPTLSKVLRGRMESVTIDRLALWLAALGRTVEIHVRPYDGHTPTGQLVIAP